MEKKGREALKNRLKEKYQKDGKGIRAYLFLWPIIVLYYSCDIMPNYLVVTVASFLLLFTIKFCGQRVYKTL